MNADDKTWFERLENKIDNITKEITEIKIQFAKLPCDAHEDAIKDIEKNCDKVHSQPPQTSIDWNQLIKVIVYVTATLAGAYGITTQVPPMLGDTVEKPAIVQPSDQGVKR